MKITQEQQQKGRDLYQSIVNRAWKDDDFKNELIKNPKGTIEKTMGGKVKEEYKLVVEDQTNSSFIYLNIPKKINIENFELTEEQLELVAGGKTSYNGWNPVIWVGVGLHEAWNWITE